MHDNPRYFIKIQRFTPHQLWQQGRPQVALSARGYVLSDDTVLDKHHSQRNHIALAVRAWTRLKQAAYQTQKTVYQLKQGFLDAYMRHELLQPALAFA